MAHGLELRLAISGGDRHGQTQGELGRVFLLGAHANHVEHAPHKPDVVAALGHGLSLGSWAYYGAVLLAWFPPRFTQQHVSVAHIRARVELRTCCIHRASVLHVPLHAQASVHIAHAERRRISAHSHLDLLMVAYLLELEGAHASGALSAPCSAPCAAVHLLPLLRLGRQGRRDYRGVGRRGVPQVVSRHRQVPRHPKEARRPTLPSGLGLDEVAVLHVGAARQMH